MPYEVEATYENGSLKLDHPLPLDEHQRVRVVVRSEATLARRTYGLIGWTGDPEIVRKIALDPEFGPQDTP